VLAYSPHLFAFHSYTPIDPPSARLQNRAAIFFAEPVNCAIPSHMSASSN
jgi:hypothetical protein